MTKEEEKRIIAIYGPDYRYLDIPAYIRQRDKMEAEDKHIRSKQDELRKK
jgi:hypothetical protein